MKDIFGRLENTIRLNKSKQIVPMGHNGTEMYSNWIIENNQRIISIMSICILKLIHMRWNDKPVC